MQTLVVLYFAQLLVGFYCCFARHMQAHALMRGLAAAVGVKLLEVIINLAYYTRLSRSGHSSPALLIASKLGDVLTNAVFLALLLIVSLGWSITRHSLTHREMQVPISPLPCACLWLLLAALGAFARPCKEGLRRPPSCLLPPATLPSLLPVPACDLFPPCGVGRDSYFGGSSACTASSGCCTRRACPWPTAR